MAEIVNIEDRRQADHRRRAAHYLEQAADLVRSAGKLDVFDGETSILLHLSIAADWLRNAAKEKRS